MVALLSILCILSDLLAGWSGLCPNTQPFQRFSCCIFLKSYRRCNSRSLGISLKYVDQNNSSSKIEGTPAQGQRVSPEVAESIAQRLLVFYIHNILLHEGFCSDRVSL